MLLYGALRQGQRLIVYNICCTFLMMMLWGLCTPKGFCCMRAYMLQTTDSDCTKLVSALLLHLALLSFQQSETHLDLLAPIIHGMH
jgi:hypothetical protein